MYANGTTLDCCLDNIDSGNREQIINKELQSIHLHVW